MASIGEPVVHSNSPGAFDELERAVVDMRERFLSIGEHITGLLDTLTHQIDAVPHATRASIHGAADQIARTQQKLRLQMTNLPANPEERYQIMRSLLQAQSGALQQLSIIVQQYTPQVALPAPSRRDGLAELSPFDNGYEWASGPRDAMPDHPLAHERYPPPRTQIRKAKPAARPAKRPPARRGRGTSMAAIVSSRLLGLVFMVVAGLAGYSYFPSVDFLHHRFPGADFWHNRHNSRSTTSIATSSDHGGKDQTSLTSSTEEPTPPERRSLARPLVGADEPSVTTAAGEAPALPLRVQALPDSGTGDQAAVVTTTTTLPTWPVTPRTPEPASAGEQGGTQALLAPKPSVVPAETETAPAEPRFVAVVFTHQDRETALDAFADLRQRYPNLLSRRKPEA